MKLMSCLCPADVQLIPTVQADIGGCQHPSMYFKWTHTINLLEASVILPDIRIDNRTQDVNKWALNQSSGALLQPSSGLEFAYSPR
jgi:hypothetical protein